jgi:hypothetical protein
VDVKNGGTSMLSAPISVTAGAYAEGTITTPAIADEATVTWTHITGHVAHVERHHGRASPSCGCSRVLLRERFGRSMLPGPFSKRLGNAPCASKGQPTTMPYLDFQTARHQPRPRRRAPSSTWQRDNAIDLAAIRYSSDRPQLKVVDVAAAGGNALALPNSWEVNFSELIAASTRSAPTRRRTSSARRYRLYLKTDGTQEIRFDDALPARQRAPHLHDQAALVAGGAAGHDPDRRSRGGVQVRRRAASTTSSRRSIRTRTDSTIQADAVLPEQGRRAAQAGRPPIARSTSAHLGIDDKKSNPPASPRSTVSLGQPGRPALLSRPPEASLIARRDHPHRRPTSSPPPGSAPQITQARARALHARGDAVTSRARSRSARRRARHAEAELLERGEQLSDT